MDRGVCDAGGSDEGRIACGGVDASASAGCGLYSGLWRLVCDASARSSSVRLSLFVNKVVIIAPTSAKF